MAEDDRIFRSDRVTLGVLATAAMIVISQYYVLSGRVGDLNAQVAGMQAHWQTISTQLAQMLEKGSGPAQRTEAVLSQLVDRQRQTELTLSLTDQRMRAEHTVLEGRVFQRIDRLEQELRARKRGG